MTTRTGDGDGAGNAIGTAKRVAFNHDLLSGLALILLGTFAYLWGPGWGPRAWTFPNLICCLMVGMGVALAVKGIRRRTREKLFESWRAAVDVAWFSASVLTFFVLIPRIGYFAATWLFMVVQALLLGGRRDLRVVVATIAVGGLVAFGLHQLFAEGFDVRLPEGDWL